MYVYTYIYIYIKKYMYIYIYIYKYKYTCRLIYRLICIKLHIYIYICIHRNIIKKDIHAYTYIYHMLIGHLLISFERIICSKEAH